MSRILNLPNRLTIGIAAIALLAVAATTTTLATQRTHAQSVPPTVDAACAAQAADTAPETTGAPDTDTADVQCGDQTGVDAAGAETADAAEPAGAADTDTTQAGAGGQTEEGDQTTPDVAGTAANN